MRKNAFVGRVLSWPLLAQAERLHAQQRRQAPPVSWHRNCSLITTREDPNIAQTPNKQSTICLASMMDTGSIREENGMAQHVREVMQANPVTMPATSVVVEAARTMCDADIGSIIVHEHDQKRRTAEYVACAKTHLPV